MSYSYEHKLIDLFEEVIVHSNRNEPYFSEVKEAYLSDRSGSDNETLQNKLDFFQMCIHYLLFDLEATRRENQYLKHLLDCDE